MIKRIEAGPRMSQAVVHGNTVYIAGQVATDPTADVSGQTRQILNRIEVLLAAAGTDKSKLLACTIYLADISTFAAMNYVWDSWVVPGSTPARATVEAALASPEYTVEIVAIAALTERRPGDCPVLDGGLLGEIQPLQQRVVARIRAQRRPREIALDEGQEAIGRGARE